MTNTSSFGNVADIYKEMAELESNSSTDETELKSITSEIKINVAKIDREITNTKARSKLEQKDYEESAKKTKEEMLKQAMFSRQNDEKTLKDQLSRLDIELKQDMERLQFERQAAEKNIKQALENLDNKLLLRKQDVETCFKDQMNVVANWEDKIQKRINELEDAKTATQMDGEKRTRTLQARIDVKDKRVAILKQAIADIKEMNASRNQSSK